MRATVVLGLLVATVATAAAAPTFEVARITAQKTGAALVIEMGATWCVPCNVFERDVLPEPEVQRALTMVSFVRYDADVAPGPAVASQLGISGFPTFVIIDPATGDELERIEGMQPHSGTGWFVQLLERAQTRTAKLAVLRAAIAARPDDPVALIALGDYERTTGQTLAAIGHYHEAEQSPRTTTETTARARDAIQRLDTAERLQRGLGGDLDLVTRRPGSPRASAALMRLAVGHHVPRARLRELATTHLEALNPRRWIEVADAVYVGLFLADHETTVQTARGWFRIEPDNPAMKLLMAEIALGNRDVELAANDMRRICEGKPPAGFELQCYALRVAIAARQWTPPGVVHAMETTRAQLEGNPPDRWRDLESLADFGSFGSELVETLRTAAVHCADATTYEALLTLDLDVDLATERLRVLAIHGAREATLDVCLREKLTGLRIAGRPRGVTAFAIPLVVEERPPSCDTCTRGATPPVPTGGVAFAAMSSGALVARGVGAAGLVDVGPLNPLRFFAGGDAQVGITDDDEASYSAHALFGIGGSERHGLLTQLIMGVGVSGHGDTEPFAFDVPIELRLSLLAPRFHYQLWGRATVVLGEESRTMQRLGGDEMAIGLGLSAPIAGVRVFAGAEVGLSVAGTTSVFRVGIPIGAGY